MFRKSLIVCLTLATFILIGACSFSWDITDEITYTQIKVGPVDQCSLALRHRVFTEKHGATISRCREQLLLGVSNGDWKQQEIVLKEIEHPSNLQAGVLRHDHVAAHTDQTRRKVWFVDHDSGRILATYDLDSRKATGPDCDPPAWAKSHDNPKNQPDEEQS